MVTIKLSKRLKAVYDLVSSKVIIDVGTDHGLLPCALLKGGIVTYAILIDISPKCLKKAEEILKEYRGKSAFFFVSDGLEILSKKNIGDVLHVKNFKAIPQVIISGIGGFKIIDILSKTSSKKFNNFILQPQKDVVKLRQFLEENDFEIEKDIVVKEGNMFYNVIVSTRSKTRHKLPILDMYFGKTNVENMSGDFIDFLKFKKAKCEQILKQKHVEKIEKYLDLVNTLLRKVK